MDDANDSVTDITGDVVTLTAGSGIGASANSLDTASNSITASVTSASLINLNEANAVTLTSVSTPTRRTTDLTGGATIIGSITSSTDSDTNDVNLTASSGDITVGTVSAGTVSGDVTV